MDEPTQEKATLCMPGTAGFLSVETQGYCNAGPTSFTKWMWAEGRSCGPNYCLHPDLLPGSQGTWRKGARLCSEAKWGMSGAHESGPWQGSAQSSGEEGIILRGVRRQMLGLSWKSCWDL